VTEISRWLELDSPEYIAVWISKMDKKLKTRRPFVPDQLVYKRKQGVLTGFYSICHNSEN
jgi:hypothetical protein